MSVECTTCGHLIPAGQFRCGKCGALAPRESLEDFGGLTEGLADAPVPALESTPEPRIEQRRTPVPRPSEPPAPEPRSAAKSAVERRAEEPGAGQPEGEPSQQVETVPRGTFASETPAAPFPSREEPGEAKASSSREPAVSATSSAIRSAAASSSQRVKQLRVATRPPYLASEILREDLTPLTPGQRAMWGATQLAGGLGLLATLLFGYASVPGVLCAVACIGLIVLGRAPLEYETRAAAVAALSGVALTGAATARFALGASHDDPLLALACALLPGALLFRAWYRAAQLARALVAVALALAFAWAAMTSHRGLLTLGFTWQSWLPALAWYLFVILCLLSMLAFMGNETTGGCAAWALGLCSWYALFVVLRAAMESQTFAPAMRSAAYGLGVAEAAFAPPLAVALAQLCARAFVSRQRSPAVS